MAPTTPLSPDVPLLASRVVNGTRECRVTASVFTQQLATLPFKTAWRFYLPLPARHLEDDEGRGGERRRPRAAAYFMLGK